MRLLRGGFRFRAGAALVRLLSAMALANLLAESHDSILDGTKTALYTSCPGGDYGLGGLNDESQAGDGAYGETYVTNDSVRLPAVGVIMTARKMPRRLLMPPHCDSMDGPVVLAAQQALQAENVDLVLAYVHEAAEDELRRAFELALKARSQGEEARDVSDLFFFETAVRLHRAGEGAPYTGLKPTGLDVGPVIPLAERAIAASAPDRLSEFLVAAVRHETENRFGAMLAAKASADTSVAANRLYVGAMLGLEVWAHRLYVAIHADAHEAASHRHE